MTASSALTSGTGEHGYKPPSRARVLVVGALPGSLGEAVSQDALRQGYDVVEAGIGGEAVSLDLLTSSMTRMQETLAAIQPRHVVCTVGLNMPQPPLSQERDLYDWYRWHFQTNVIGPMRLLDAWACTFGDPDYLPDLPLREMCHYVAISSNSAHIPRTKSAAYCASKAALSMALRVAGREAIGGNGGYIVYGYEPGLLAGTPMTAATEKALDMETADLHRMRGNQLMLGIQPRWLARAIVANLGVPGPTLNGCLIPFDGDEL